MEPGSEETRSTNPVQEIQFRSRNKNPLKPLLALIALIILVAVVTVLFLNFSKKKGQNKVATTSSQKTATTSTSKKTENCNKGQIFTASKHGYQVCYSLGWQAKETDVSQLTVGFSSKTIDTSFPGTITVAISDSSVELALENRINTTSKFAYGTASVASEKATQIEFTRLKSDALSNYPLSIETYFSKFGRTYTVGLNSTDSSYAEDKALYDEFLASWKFLKETKDPPWSASGNIIVNYPWLGDKIGSPLEIQGQAIAFEAVVNIRIKDSAGHTLADTTVKTASGTERSVFKEKISFEATTSKDGVVEVFTTSAKDGSEQDKVSIPVVFH